MINRDIKEQLGYLTAAADSHSFGAASEIHLKLAELTGKKQIAMGMTDGFSARINELRLELASLSGQHNLSSVRSVSAPASGYFVKEADGYEGMLSPDTVESYGLDDYLQLLDNERAAPAAQSAGKIVLSQNWMFAAAAEKASLEFVRAGQALSVSFDTESEPVPATVTRILQDKDEERAVILLSCDEVSGKLLNLRKTAVTLRFNRYSGLRINADRIRFVGNNRERGVYVLEDGAARFKRLEPIYEEQDFILSLYRPPKANEEEFVRQFDQIIVRGINLYDGKPIQ
jgi:hypothetical protein